MVFGPVSWILLSPLLGALILFFIPKDQIKIIRGISIAATSLSLLFALWIFLLFDVERGGYQFVDKIEWIQTFDISYHVGVDGINVVLLLLCAFCSFAGVFVALSITERVKEYYIFYLFLIVGCFGVLSSLNVFFMYFFYETAVIPVFPLIAIWGSGNKEYASMKLTLYLTLGAVLALVSIIALYWATGLKSFNFIVLEKVLAADPLPGSFQRWAFPMILVGFGVIVTLWPFHTWSPIGYAAAPTSVSMLHAGVLKKLGAYLIIRLGITLMPEGAQFWMPFVAWIAVINIIYCGLVAFSQKDLKYILGYSSCSHMGYILLGLACLTPIALNGTIYFMFAHGIMAALGFALVGFVYDQTHTRSIEDWGGLGKKLPFLASAFVIMALASSGVPGFANFIGEILILLGSWDRYRIQAILAVGGLLITAGYMLNMVRYSMQGPLSVRWHDLKDARGVQKIPYVVLVATLIIAGFLPVLLLPKIQSGTQSVIDHLYPVPRIIIKQEALAYVP